MRKSVFLLLVLFCSNLLLAQKILHSKNRKAIQLYEQAYELDSLGNYFQSEPLLRQAISKDDSFDEAHLLLFMTLMKKTDINGARGVMRGASDKVEDTFKNRMLLELATFFWSSGRYSDASGLVSQVSGDVYNADGRIVEQITESIKFSLQSHQSNLKIEFEELKSPMNIYESQYFPSITSEGAIVFTGRVKGRRGINEDLFIASPNSGGWSRPEVLSDSINTANFNEGTASISADGLSIVFTGCNRPEGLGSCDLYASYFRYGEWTKPENLGPQINTKHWESQPSLSQDGRQLFFVSTKPGGLGGQDIWLSNKINGRWTEAVNLGESINTLLDDCSPYIHPDGETLYFASRGRIGLGGYDLYMTTTDGKNWSEPQNLGFPINTSENQVGYTLGLDGWAYYSDNNFAGQTKLYRFKMPEELLPKRKLTLFAGYVQDSESQFPLSADISLADLASDSTVVETYSKKNGTFNFVPPNENKNYIVYAHRPGYNLFKDELLNLEKKDDKYLIELTPLSIGDKVILNNVLFDFNSAALDINARKELQIATKFLQDNSTINVEIGGHTDAVGDDNYNLNLSNNRAKSVYDYLISKGINPQRLSFKGYGETQPLIKTEDGQRHPENRRIELIILEM